MRSASAKQGLIAVSCLLPLAALTGCETTQQTSDRLKIRAERILASRAPVEVKKANRSVQVLDVTIVRGAKQAAIAVTLRNRGPRPVNDLPLAVGVEAGEGTVFVNQGSSFRYFEAHAPVLAPRRATTWVFTAPAAKLPGGSPVARVGFPADAPTEARALPRLRVTRIVSSSGKQPTVEATIANEAGFPQYDLSVYAWAKREGRYVAAGQKSIGNLGTGKQTRVKLALVGDPGEAKVHVSAPPTIFE